MLIKPLSNQELHMELGGVGTKQNKTKTTNLFQSEVSTLYAAIFPTITN